jgi:type IV secretory pathway VirB2 component (pilin)
MNAGSSLRSESQALFLSGRVVKIKPTNRKPNPKEISMNRARRLVRSLVPMSVFTLANIVPRLSFAAIGGGGMPWDSPLDNIRASICGPTAKNLIFIAIALLGISIALSEGGSILRKCLMVGLGAVIVTSGAQWFFGRVGMGGGLGI